MEGGCTIAGRRILIGSLVAVGRSTDRKEGSWREEY
jgi:hypothetical protein